MKLTKVYFIDESGKEVGINLEAIPKLLEAAKTLSWGGNRIVCLYWERLQEAIELVESGEK